MKFVAILLSLLLAVAPSRAWAIGSVAASAAMARSGAGTGAGGLSASASDRRAPTMSGGASVARAPGGQTSSARSNDPVRSPVTASTSPTAGQGGLSSRRVEHEFGIPARNQQALQSFADRRGLVIDVRPTNPASVRWLNQGALPKPEAIKAKTVNAHDLMLNRNLPRDSGGLVALFKPVLPERPANMSDRAWAGLKARYTQRLDEWHKLSSVIGKGAQEGQYRVTANGQVEGRDAKGEWRSITGDHDLFEIRKVDGSRLGRREEDAVIREMKGRNMGVQHGAHMSWSPVPGSWEHTKIYEPIVRGHGPGGEPLVRFAPGKKPELAWAGTPIKE